jgi:hypothetical protein
VESSTRFVSHHGVPALPSVVSVESCRLIPSGMHLVYGNACFSMTLQARVCGVMQARGFFILRSPDYPAAPYLAWPLVRRRPASAWMLRGSQRFLGLPFAAGQYKVSAHKGATFHLALPPRRRRRPLSSSSPTTSGQPHACACIEARVYMFPPDLENNTLSVDLYAPRAEAIIYALRSLWHFPARSGCVPSSK